jgi:alpha-ketoglutarate-dependent taurine dioxygenase
MTAPALDLDARTASATHASVRPLGSTMGARVTGVDLCDRLSPVDLDRLWSLLLAHKVLVFGGQSLDADSLVAFARQFGPLTPSHPVMAPVDVDHPEVWEIDSRGAIRNDVWHTDVTFVERPPLGSVLRAVRVPEIGGDTSWADLEAAYASLSAPIRTAIDGLTALHDGSRSFASSLAQRGSRGNDWDGTAFSAFTPVEHPVVRVHPETGRRSLFVNPEFTLSINGVSSYESRGLLDALYAHITKPEHVVRHAWTAGDVVIWDNRCTAHYANLDYGSVTRVMQRVTWVGDVPVGPRSSATPSRHPRRP